MRRFLQVKFGRKIDSEGSKVKERTIEILLGVSKTFSIPAGREIENLVQRGGSKYVQIITTEYDNHEMQNNLKIWYFSAVIEDKKSCFLLLYTALSHHLLNLCRRSISPWLTIATWRALTHSFQTLLTFTRVKYLSRCTPFPLPDNNGSSSNVSWKRRPCRLLRHVVVHWLSDWLQAHWRDFQAD